MTRSTPMVGLVATIGVCLLVSCTVTPVQTPTPGASPPTPSPGATTTATPVPSPTEPPTGSPGPTASPAPSEGLGWTAIALPLDAGDSDAAVSDVIAGGPGFVAVGGEYDRGNIWTSAGGITWELVSRGREWDGVSINRVVDWNGLLVAAGADGDHAAFWTSSDGRAWQRVPDSRKFDFYTGRTGGGVWGGQIERLRVDGAELVAEGLPNWDIGGRVDQGAWAISQAGPGAGIPWVTWRTADGIAWTREETLDAPPPVAQGPGGDGWLRVVRDSIAGALFTSIETSADGGAWHTVYSGPASSWLSDLRPYDGGWIAVGWLGFGPSGALVVTSPDGLTWTSSDRAYTPDLANGSMTAVAVAGDRLVAVGDHLYRPVAFVSPPVAAPVPPGGVLSVAWTQRTFASRSSLAVADGVVYFVGGDGKLYAFAVGCASGGATCSPLWTATAPSGYFETSSPAVADGVVYVGYGDPNNGGGQLIAFSVGCASGGAPCSPLWSAETSGTLYGPSPVVADGAVYVGDGDGKLYAFAVGCASGGATCAPLWTATAPSGSYLGPSPVVADGVVYVGSYDGKLYAFAVGCASGGVPCSPLWSAETSGTLYGPSAVIADGAVYVGDIDGTLYAFAVGCASGGATCAPLWTATIGRPIHSSPAVADGVVYVAADHDELYAFAVDCANGGATCSPLWTGGTDFGFGMSTAPAVADGVVYVGSYDGKLYAFAIGCASGGEACEPILTGTTGGAITSAPVVADGELYVGSEDGKLYAFALEP